MQYKYFQNDQKIGNITLYTVGSTSKKVAKTLGYKNVIDCQGDSVKMFMKSFK